MKKYRLGICLLITSPFLLTACSNINDASNSNILKTELSERTAYESIITSADAISVNKIPLASDDELCEQLSTIFRSSIESNFLKTQAATGIINRYDVTQVRSVMACLSESPNDYPGYLVKRLLMNRYAFLDPAAAMQTLEKVNFSIRASRESLEYAVFTHWVNKSPTQALFWLNDRGYGRASSRLVSLVFSALAKDDYDKALTLTTTLPDREDLKHDAISGIMHHATANEQFLSLLNEIDTGVDFYPPLAAWFIKDQHAVFQYIDTLKGQRKINAINSAFDAYIVQAPFKAGDWYVSVLKGGRSDIEHVIHQLRFTSPALALDWILQSPNLDTQEQLESFFSSESLSSPRFVVEHIHLIKSAEKRLDISKDVYNALSGISLKQANAFAAGSEFGDEIKTRN